MQPIRSSRVFLRRYPFLKLLAINLASGTAVAVLIVAGLLAFDARHLRQLIAGDQSPWIALILLLFGFVVTFGSCAMGAAIMGLGVSDRGQQ